MPDESLIRSDQETANILNIYFANMCEKDRDDTLLDFENMQYMQALDNIIINEKHIEKVLKSLNPNKSQGPDNLHPKFIKETQFELSKALTIILKNLIDEGKIPEMWKSKRFGNI